MNPRNENLSVTLPRSGGQRAPSVMILPYKGSGQILKSQKQPSTADFKGLRHGLQDFLRIPHSKTLFHKSAVTFKSDFQTAVRSSAVTLKAQVSPESCLSPGNSTHIPTPLPKWGWIHAGFANEEGGSLGGSNFISPHHCPASLSTNHSSLQHDKGSMKQHLGKFWQRREM